MFGNLGRTGAQARRSRRKIGLIAIGVLVLALIIGELIDDVVKADGPANTTNRQTWVVAVGSLIAESNGQQKTYSNFRDALLQLDDAHLHAVLGQLVSGTESLQSDLANLNLPPASERSRDLLESVLSTRASAMAHLSQAIQLATGSGLHKVSRAANLVSAVGRQLISADLTYKQFVKSLGTLPRTIRPVASQWVSEPGNYTAAVATSWVTGIANEPAFAATRKLAIVAISLGPQDPVVSISGIAGQAIVTTTTITTTTTTTIPLASGAIGVTGSHGTTSSTVPKTTTTIAFPTTTTLQIPPGNSVSRLQPASSINVDVVVKNTGTLSAPSVTVAASVARHGTLVNRHTPSSPSSTHKVLTSLAAGQSQYLALAPLGVERGNSYVLTVVVSTPGTAAVQRTVSLQIAS